LTLPAGEARTGFVIAASLAAVAQFRADGVVPLALHAVCAGLAYLFFVNLSKRKLGAPLIAAVLFGAHPFVASTMVGDAGLRGLGGAALALLAGVLLARTPLDRRLLWPALVAYAASLPLAPGAAAVPFLVAAAAVAYHGLEPSKLLTKRLFPRFAVFLVPLAAYVAWTARTGTPRGFGAALDDVASAALPFSSPTHADAAAGTALVAALVLFGALRLRATPKAAWPLLAAGLSLVAAAMLVDAWGHGASAYAALAFLSLAAAEAIEEIYYRYGGAVAAPLMFLVWAAFVVRSHMLS
jgi:hypothetical protein